MDYKIVMRLPDERDFFCCSVPRTMVIGREFGDLIILCLPPEYVAHPVIGRVSVKKNAKDHVNLFFDSDVIPMDLKYNVLSIDVMNPE